MTQTQNLRKIKLKLASKSVKKAITSILASVDLPTSYVDSISSPEIELSTKNYTNFYAGEKDVEYDPKAHLDLMHPTDVRRPLSTWLRDNIENAQLKMAKSEPLRLQTERLQDEICQNCNLVDLQFEGNWDIAYKRGVLASFNNLTKDHSDIKSILSQRTLVFGHESGMTLAGHIILYTGEVRTNWLKVIRNIENFEASLKNIPLVEKALSQSLRNIKISHRKNQPLRLVEDYKSHLMKLVTKVNDYLSKQKLPQSWPLSMEEYGLCVDNESSPLTLSKTGQFISPASCPGFLLIPFIREHS